MAGWPFSRLSHHHPPRISSVLAAHRGAWSTGPESWMCLSAMLLSLYQQLPLEKLGSWQWHVSSFVSSRLSQPVAPIPVPKREQEGGPGRKSLSSQIHTHTHHSPPPLTPGTATLPTRLARGAAALPFHTAPESMPGCWPAPTCLVPRTPCLLTEG